MKKIITLLLLWGMHVIPLSASIVGTLSISNTHPITNCTYAHCKLAIENTSPQEENVAIDLVHRSLKLVNYSVPKQLLIAGGKRMEYNFDCMVVTEGTIDSAEMKIELNNRTSQTSTFLQQSLYPVTLKKLDWNTPYTVSCTNSIQLLQNQNTLTEDIEKGLLNGLTLFAAPNSTLLVPNNHFLKDKNISVVGCQSDWQGIEIDTPTNYTDLSNILVNVYPNPTNETLVVWAVTDAPLTVRIFNMAGQMMSMHEGSTGLRISTNELEAGAYLLKITTTNGTSVKPFTKIK